MEEINIKGINRSDFPTKIYEIIPTETYKIIRNCAGCGCKSIYGSTDKIRVNANGKQIDVWLIYRCNKCKHTYNLPIYSRVNRNTLDKAEYEALLQNDAQMVNQYGLDRNIFHQNGLNMLEEPSYLLRDTGECAKENTITIRNPYHLRIRNDKLISDCLMISRNEAKKFLENGLLFVT
jgi:hypothetical protein